LQISTKSTVQFLSNSCFKNGTQKQKLPIWKIPINLLHEVSLSNRTVLQLTELVTPWSFCLCDTPDFISPLLWPPNSPDLNPVDYEVWGVLQQRVCRGRIRDIDHLKQRLIKEWHCLDQNITDRAVRQWRVRLRACVRANGSHFERKL